MTEQPYQPPRPPLAAARSQPPVVHVNVHQPQQPVVVTRGNDAGVHLIHLMLTLVTFGLWLPIWIIHAIVMAGRRPAVVAPVAPPVTVLPQPWTGPPRPPLTPEQTNRYAVEQVNARAQRRREARQLALHNPLMARELRIGRSDIPAEQRAYDDGGLIDVNLVPAKELTRFGLDYAAAERVVELREHTDGFTSAEDLATVADLPPRLLPELIEYGLYLR
ncbi:ComEA family DNA-binding protein [Actinomadura hibisca]|uniref:ComEA family DNA-binding protein n=1 Tax=Actinomadura hibisca TaxID=68565 RepID=UPI00082F55C3|nr:helix-hairpin-helix domain-containing protein [Actinomadura hibisca]